MLQVFDGVLHPFELESCRPIVEARKTLHPLRLFRRWDLAEPYQGDADAALTEPCRQLASIIPDSTQGICRHQHMHTDPCSDGLCGLRVMKLLPSTRGILPVAMRRNASPPNW